MKTPEEIKKGLDCCIDGDCDSCPYNGLKMDCSDAMKSDALAYIQQLEAQVPKWISVEERLPEESDDVLVIANGKPAPRVTLHNALLIASYWVEEGWLADGFNGWDALKVTHWMPLPELPKEE